MAAGSAQTIYDQDRSQGPVAICDIRGHAKWHDLWVGNPAVAHPDPGYPEGRAPQSRWVKNSKFCRPYIQYPFTDDTGWIWATNWRARDHRGLLYLTPQETAVGADLSARYGPFLLLEPTPVRGNKNRRWPDAKWEDLSEALRALGLPIVQLQHAASRLLPNTIWAPHHGFRQACGVLSAASLFVSTEGGLVHASAALGIPTVALWGGCVSCDVLGYPEHVNLVDEDPRTPCGKWRPCAHCADAWSRLTADRVAEATSVHWDQIQQQVAHG